MGVSAGKVDAILAMLGGRRRGVVTREELLVAGLSHRQIDARLASGALIQLFPGVYVVGHMALAPFAREAAALVACRPRALLGRRTAARLWELPIEAPMRTEVLVVRRHRRSLERVRVSSVDHLAPDELRWLDGLPLTSPSLTLLDLAGCVKQDKLTACLHEARVQRLVTDKALQRTLEAHPNRRGARPLGALLKREGAAKVTRSEAERLALRLMRAHNLDPDSDVRIGPYRVDFLFRAERLIVEVDGFRFHATPERFAQDRRRTAALMGMGYVVFPLSWADLTNGAPTAMARLFRALDKRRRLLSPAV